MRLRFLWNSPKQRSLAQRVRREVLVGYWAAPALFGLLMTLPLFAQSDVRALLRKDKPAEALELANRLMVGRACDAVLLATAGDAQFRLGLFETAKASYVRSLACDAGSARALLGLGRLNITLKMHRTAEALIRRAYAADSDDPEILRDWADVQEDYLDEVAALERYLLLGIEEDQEKLIDARNRISFLKTTGGLKSATLTDPPEEAVVRLSLVETRGFGIAISINGGKAETLLFDTGAGGITIPRKLAMRLGVKPIASSRLSGVGDGGWKTASMGIAESLQIGPLHYKDVPVTISDKQSTGTSAGLMGSSLFNEFVATLDGPRRILRLDLRRAMDGEGDAVVPSGEEEFTKVRAFHHLLLVDTVAGGKTNGWFLIDSGASSNMISLALARAARVYTAPGNVQLTGVSGRVDRPVVARGLDLLFAGFHWANREAMAFEFQNLNKSVGTEISGLIGFPTLEQIVTTIDYPNGLVRFQKEK